MATYKTLFTKCQILKSKSTIISQQNGSMSQYANFYVKPIFKQKEQDELYKSGEAQKMAHIPTRAALADQTSSLFHNDHVRLFTNYVMKCGMKTLARELVEKSFEKVKRTQLEKYHKATTDEARALIELNPNVIFMTAVENAKPVLQLTPIKRGGVRYQVPVPITDKRSQFISMKWIIDAANDKERTTHFPEKLATELIDAAANTGRVIKKKQELHKQCEANRAYAHYRWS